MADEKIPSIFNLPPLVWVLIVVVVGAFALNMSSTPLTNSLSPYTPPVSASNNESTSTPVIPAALPSDLVDVAVSDSSPLAGDEVTFTATVKSAYSDWEKLFAFEIWVRQFGNWQKTNCYSSPCVYTLNDASLGTIEYKIVRTAKDGSVSDEGSDYLEVASTVQTGDTIGPQVTLSHTPQNPKAGQSVTIVALVNDISSLEGVQLFLNGGVIKTCSQNLKILTCQETVSNLVEGTYSYYATATDSKGNTTQTETLAFGVAP